ncbi:MAG: YlxR family protein [Gordonia sp. (in: high G+C Gram-positive bacteria)]
MCVGCRERAGTDELVRLVARLGERPQIVVDRSKTMPGRGAWLHRRAECVSAAVRRKAFGPALRTRGLIVDPSDLAEVLAVDADATRNPTIRLSGQNR